MRDEFSVAEKISREYSVERRKHKIGPVHLQMQTAPYQNTVCAPRALQKDGTAHGPRQAGKADYNVRDEPVGMKETTLAKILKKQQMCTQLRATV
jgi:hypothetical protein